MTENSKRELAVSQAAQTIKPHLELDVKHLAEKTPMFTQALDAFLSSNLDDPTGFNVSNLRLMVQFLRMDYERIDGLLQRLEPEESQTFSKRMPDLSDLCPWSQVRPATSSHHFTLEDERAEKKEVAMSIPRSEQSAPGVEHTTETRTAFCATCPDPQEVERLLQAFGFHLVFSLPSDTAGEYQTDLPPLPAQYHYEDALGTQVEYLAGVDTPSLDNNPCDGEGLSPMRFPPHASRFWLTMGGQELAARRVQERLADQWALHWRERQRVPSFEAVA